MLFRWAYCRLQEIYGGKPKHQTFFVVSDCHCSARLHKTEDDSMEDFILKLRTLSNEATKFADYLMSISIKE